MNVPDPETEERPDVPALQDTAATDAAEAEKAWEEEVAEAEEEAAIFLLMATCMF